MKKTFQSIKVDISDQEVADMNTYTSDQATESGDLQALQLFQQMSDTSRANRPSIASKQSTSTVRIMVTEQ